MGEGKSPIFDAHLLKYLLVVAALLDQGESVRAHRVINGLVYALENQAAAAGIGAK